MRAIGRGFTAQLRVGFTLVSVEIVTTMVAQMRDEGSAVSFSLQQGEPQLLETMVELRQADFAITHMPVGNCALGVEPLAPMTIVLLCREGDDRWPSDGDIAPEALTDVPLILLRRRAGGGIYDRIIAAFAAAGVACSIVADCNDTSAIYTLIERNVGLGLIPVHALHAQRPGFSMHPVALLPTPERLALIYPRGRRQLPAVQRAMDICRKTLR
jgi:LysR family transcriptional regulator, salicylic acid-responsive activator of bsdBCD